LILPAQQCCEICSSKSTFENVYFVGAGGQLIAALAPDIAVVVTKGIIRAEAAAAAAAAAASLVSDKSLLPTANIWSWLARSTAPLSPPDTLPFANVLSIALNNVPVP
jgi:hypothetical protein